MDNLCRQNAILGKNVIMIFMFDMSQIVMDCCYLYGHYDPTKLSIFNYYTCTNNHT